MTALSKALGLLTALIWSAQVASAEDSEWTFDASLYFFLPEATTTVGGNSVTIGYRDAARHFDGVLMGGLYATNRRWGFLLDYMYGAIDADKPLSNPLIAGPMSRLRIALLPVSAIIGCSRIPRPRLISAVVCAGSQQIPA